MIDSGDARGSAPITVRRIMAGSAATVERRVTLRVRPSLIRSVALGVSLLVGAASMPMAQEGRILPILPAAQQTGVWCWAAVGEMVLRHFRYPTVNGAGNYQCGIVAVAGWGTPCMLNCALPMCIQGIGTAERLAAVLQAYPIVLGGLTGRPVPGLAMSMAGALDPEDIVAEIDAGRPVIAGISPGGLGHFLPPGVSEHVALIVGYRRDPGSRLVLVVNDPMPMAILPFNPYLRAGGRALRPGQYAVSYESFLSQIGYKDSLYGFTAD